MSCGVRGIFALHRIERISVRRTRCPQPTSLPAIDPQQAVHILQGNDSHTVQLRAIVERTIGLMREYERAATHQRQRRRLRGILLPNAELEAARPSASDTGRPFRSS